MFGANQLTEDGRWSAKCSNWVFVQDVLESSGIESRPVVMYENCRATVPGTKE